MPQDCAEKWWREHDARGGRDRHGQPLERWESNLLAYAAAWRANEERAKKTNENRSRSVERWPYLVLDDIGAERDPSGFSAEKLATLLGCRGGRWTVITGNLSLAQVEAIDVRIASRMPRDGSQVVEVTAMDYALRGD